MDNVDGIKKIGAMWLTYVELDRIESILMNHLIQNNMSIKDINNILSEFLNEVLKEKFFK